MKSQFFRQHTQFRLKFKKSRQYLWKNIKSRNEMKCINCRNEMMLLSCYCYDAVSYLSSEWLLFPVADDPSLGKTSEDFRFIFFLRFAQEKNKQKIRSHLGPVPQVSLKRSHLVTNN